MSRRMIRSALAAACVALAAPAFAAGDAAPPAPRPRHDVDESALRFYAQQNDRPRVEAESRRLKALYPDWSVPDDLYEQRAQGTADEQPLWELFSEDRLEEMRQLIEARKVAEPGWEPSRDLTLKIKRKETRRKVVELWNAKQWKQLVAFAQSEPMVAEIGDVDVLWTLAEGFANAKQKAGAYGIYKSILETSNDEGERLGTIHKAIANLAMNDVEKLLAMARKKADGSSEFDVIRIDIARARISAYLHDERTEEVAASDLEAFEAFAKEAPDPNQSGLVAWYRYKREEFKPALEWFKHSLGRGGDSMIAHGLSHALRELGWFRETEEVAFAWRQFLTNNRILFIDILERDLTREIPPYVETERLARYGRVAAEDASGEGAQALAWYAYNSCQFEVALEWFERAMAWLPKQETVYGYALTLRRMKRDKDFLEVVNRADGLHPKVLELLFPEERYRPPTPCEVTSWEQARWWEAFLQQNPWVLQSNDAAKENAKPLPGRQGVAPIVRHGEGPYTAGYDGFVQNALHDPLMRYSWGVVTGPTGNVYPQWRPEASTFQPPQFDPLRQATRNEYPLPVLPENPLRFTALPQPTAIAATPTESQKTAGDGQPIVTLTPTAPPAASAPPANAPLAAREPFGGPFPLIARRVEGIGPMPYEKFGIPVLPNPEPGKPLSTALSTPMSGYASGFAPGVAPGLVPARGPGGAPGPAASARAEVTGSIAGGPVAGRAVSRAGRPQPVAAPIASPYPPGYPATYPAAGAPAYRPAGPVPIMPAPMMPAPVVTTPVALAPTPYGQQAGAWSGVAAAPRPVYPQPQPVYPQPQAYPVSPQVAPQVAPQSGWPYGPAVAAYAPQPAPERVEPRPASRPPRAVRRRPAAEAEVARSAGSARGCSASLGASGTAREFSPAQAVANGWCLLNLKRPAEAAIAFERGMGAPGRTGDDAAYGKSLALLQTNQPRAAASAAGEGRLAGRRRQEIGVMALEQRVFSSYDRGDYAGALSLLRQRAPHATETRDLTLMRGWSMFQLGKLDEAERIFRALDAQTSTKESRSGLAAVESRRTRSE